MSHEQQQSFLRFSLEESIWFKRGQEVEELLSISLDPHITIQEQEQYILIRGSLDLTGEYLPTSVQEVEEEEVNWEQLQQAGKFVHQVNNRDKGECEFVDRFPVDVTIPKNRIANLGEIDVFVESFDYVVPENACLKLTADLTISGIYGEQQTVSPQESVKEQVVPPIHREENNYSDDTFESAEEENEVVEDVTEVNFTFVDRKNETNETDESREEEISNLEAIDSRDEENANLETIDSRDTEDISAESVPVVHNDATPETSDDVEEHEYEPFAFEVRKQFDEEVELEQQADDAKEEEVPVKIHYDSQEPSPYAAVEHFRSEKAFEMPEPELSESSDHHQEPVSGQEQVVVPEPVLESAPAPVPVPEEIIEYEEPATATSPELETEIEADVEKKKKTTKKKGKYESISLTDFFARKEEEQPAKLKVCIVQEGETLENIAEKYDLNVPQLLRVNKLEANQDVYEGQVLYIPDNVPFFNK